MTYDLMYCYRDFHDGVWHFVGYCQNMSYSQCKRESDFILKQSNGSVLTRIVEHKEVASSV